MPADGGPIGAPVRVAEDDELTRRQLVGFLTLSSCGLFLGTAALGVAGRGGARPQPIRLGSLDGLPAVSTFAFPRDGDACLLIRLGAERLVAYQQACTHLRCPVTYRPGATALHCPCHEGYFAVEDGRPLAGPPKRPLQQVALEVRDGAVWATSLARP